MTLKINENAQYKETRKLSKAQYILMHAMLKSKKILHVMMLYATQRGKKHHKLYFYWSTGLVEHCKHHHHCHERLTANTRGIPLLHRLKSLKEFRLPNVQVSITNVSN